jgi:hypothetical protein
MVCQIPPDSPTPGRKAFVLPRSRLILLCGWFFGTAVAGSAANDTTPTAEHPLTPVLQMAHAAYDHMHKEIQDYTCTLAKRERVDGRLLEPELLQLKVRHAHVRDGQVVTPFSVYVRFLKPAEVKGREVLWVEGRHHGKLIVRNGGKRFEYVTLAIPPDSELAMQRNRYPITQIGVQTLTRRLIENGQDELHENDCAVKTVPGAKINGRPCTLIQVSHPVRRDQQIYQYARILVDDELRLPVYYSAYDWPKEDGGQSRLLEEYTYTDIQINVGLTDDDFDHRNEHYHFLKSFEP